MLETGLSRADSQLPVAPKFDPQRIVEVQREISLMQTVIAQRLERGIDYGRIPGTPQDSLWEPGASLIISSFRCYAGERRILSLVDDADKLAVLIEVPLISYDTGRTVATGVAAASTLEARHKYRWVDKPQEWGYESVAGLRTRERDNKTEYRIPNPEHGELLHNLVKQASKRAEMDAAENLPGVANVLRQLFQTGGNKGRDTAVWTRFWGDVRRLGFTEKQAHELLGVQSMNDWLDAGHTLDDALKALRELAAKTNPPKEPKQAPKPPWPTHTPPPPNLEIKNTMALFSAARQYFGMTQEAVLKDLGISTAQEVGDAQEAWQAIVAVHTPPPED